MVPQRLRAFAERHPYWSGCFCLLVFYLPGWINNLWQLFQDRPFVPTIASKIQHMTFPEFSIYFCYCSYRHRPISLFDLHSSQSDGPIFPTVSLSQQWA
jgi:hypothetical protein